MGKQTTEHIPRARQLHKMQATTVVVHVVKYYC
jgi:hypothetical protein